MTRRHGYQHSRGDYPSLFGFHDLPLQRRQEQLEIRLSRAESAANSHGAFISVARRDRRPTLTEARLAGLPFAVKDNIDTFDLPTTLGSRALRGSYPPNDASVVARLRNAGCVLVGKTNMDELAFGVTGNNPSFGQVRNPWNPSLSAGGSSGGSAVAVALGVVPFALGTDTGGSVTIPAAHCGIVGMRPSLGRYPRDGVALLSKSRDTVGVLTSSVTDLVFVDNLITGAGSVVKQREHLHGVRLGIPAADYFFPLEDSVLTSVRSALDLLKLSGAELVEVDLTRLCALSSRFASRLVRYEMLRELPRYLLSLDHPYSELTLVDLAAAAMTPRVTSVIRDALRSPVSDDDYQAALEARIEMSHLYRSAFDSLSIDALAFPTVPIRPRGLGCEGPIELGAEGFDLFDLTVRNVTAGTMVGAPSISLPCVGVRRAMPIGLTLEGLPGADDQLLSLALAVETSLEAGRDL